MNTDCLHINTIRVYGYTAYMPEEKISGQRFEVSLKLWFDMSLSIDTDLLGDTFNYIEMIDLVRNLIQSNKYYLIERLTQVVVDQIFEQFALVTTSHIILTKCNPPVPNFDGNVSIELLRSRV